MDILRNLKNSGFTFSKKYGQNFITDEKLLSDIADDAALTRDDVVLEVGAGAGTLTRALAERAGKVIAFEIDRSLEPTLSHTLRDYDNITVIYDDVTQ